jgi:hypothetical protein
MKHIILISTLILGLVNSGFTQSTCEQAMTQLQNYATQVNQTYYQEYWSIIPNQRCPEYVRDQWGNIIPVNPQIVQNCRLQMLLSLNQWYGQQCNYINNVYFQIMRECSSNPNTSLKPAPDGRNNNSENSKINTDLIKEMTAGIDEDKAIPIKIPKTAAGFKP